MQLKHLSEHPSDSMFVDKTCCPKNELTTICLPQTISCIFNTCAMDSSTYP